MNTYSLADTNNSLSERIDHALNGESVVITRHGVPVVELRPIRSTPHSLSEADLVWLVPRRIVPLRPLKQRADDLVSKMRDEDAGRLASGDMSAFEQRAFYV